MWGVCLVVATKSVIIEIFITHHSPTVIIILHLKWIFNYWLTKSSKNPQARATPTTACCSPDAPRSGCHRSFRSRSPLGHTICTVPFSPDACIRDGIQVIRPHRQHTPCSHSIEPCGGHRIHALSGCWIILFQLSHPSLLN